MLGVLRINRKFMVGAHAQPLPEGEATQQFNKTVVEDDPPAPAAPSPAAGSSSSAAGPSAGEAVEI